MKKMIKLVSEIAVGGILATATFLTVSGDEPVQTEAVTTVPVITEAVTTAMPTETAPIVSDTTIYTETTPMVSKSETTAETTVTSTVTTISTTVTTVTVTCPEISESVINGWNSIDGKWFYFDGQKFLTGKQRVNGEYYIFAKNGALRTGWQTVNKIRYYYDNETHSMICGWIDYHGEKYYCDKKLGKLTGMHQIDGNTYIFSDKGIMLTGFTMYEEFMYYCQEDGSVLYGDDKKTPILINGNYHYISPKGYVLRGWQTINGYRYFYDYETGLPVFGWINYKGNLYYADKILGKYTNKRYVGNFPYRFTDKGVLCTGLQRFEDENKVSYFYSDGTRAVNKLVYTNGKAYYFNEKGYMVTGWQTIEGNQYYFKATGEMAVGINSIDGNIYCFDKTGHMLTGLQLVDGSKYLLNSNGIAMYGWQIYEGKTYYFDENSGKAYSKWKTIDGDRYYFDENFAMVTGKYKIEDDYYFFDINGAMQTGWQTIDGKKHYFSTDKADIGKMYTYRHNIDGVEYIFYSTGEMITDGNQKIVVKALSQIGQIGGKPYWTWWGFNFRIEWCACFVSWCATQCGYTQAGQTPKFISCKVGIDWFKEHKQWMGRNYIPKSGDYIFFDWEPDGIADHIGIVDYYEDGVVYTVEGNSDDEVRTKKYKIDSENIYGFAAPDFLG